MDDPPLPRWIWTSSGWTC